VSWRVDSRREDGLGREVGDLERVVEEGRRGGIGWRCAGEGGDKESGEETEKREKGVGGRWEMLSEGDEDREGGCVGEEDLESWSLEREREISIRRSRKEDK